MIGPATAPPSGEPALSKPIAVAACFLGNQGPKIVLAVAVGAWSIFCGMTALATGFWSLLILRVHDFRAKPVSGETADKVKQRVTEEEAAKDHAELLSIWRPVSGRC
jgi:ACS family hexuronate transporter-like MFS transporter